MRASIATVTHDIHLVSLRRRLAAMVYDGIAVTAILYFATLVPVITMGGEIIEPGNTPFVGYLGIVTFFYFTLCWTTSGQTLGMRAWRIELLNDGDRRRISWRTAVARFLFAIASLVTFGIGYFAALLDSQRRTWHDRASHSHLVRTPLRSAKVEQNSD